MDIAMPTIHHNQPQKTERLIGSVWHFDRTPMVSRIYDTVVPPNCPVQVNLRTGQARPLPHQRPNRRAEPCRKSCRLPKLQVLRNRTKPLFFQHFRHSPMRRT